METGIRILTGEDLNTTSTTQQETLGAVGATADGRRFRYAGVYGTSTTASGLLLVSAAVTSNSTGLAITAVGTGGQVSTNLNSNSRTLVVTNGVTSVTQDQFKDGFLDVVWSGGPFSVRIEGNTAAGSGGYITFLLAPGGLNSNAALVPGTDTVNVSASPYAAAIATKTISAPVGVTVCSFATSSTTLYGWLQTGGYCEVSATSGTKGNPAAQDLAGTAGFLKEIAAGDSETSSIVGTFKESEASSLAAVILSLL